MTDKINISAEAVAAMLNGVTPGPWAAVGRFVDAHVLQIADLNAGRTGHEDANARFIAWAREAVPALAARLVEVEKSRMDLAGDKINLRSENIALQARAEAAEAKLAKARAKLREIDDEAQRYVEPLMSNHEERAACGRISRIARATLAEIGEGHE